MTRRRAGESRARAWSLAALAAALLASGCSSSGLLGASQPPASEATASTASSAPPAPPAPPAAPQPSPFRERMTALFSGRPAPQASADSSSAAAQAAASEDCPTVEIRSGASTFALGPPGTDATATTLRYQATIARTARECSGLAGNMTMKVGVQGRVILGPAGAPGVIEVPVRLALVQEGVEPKTIWTKGYRVAVNVPPGQSKVPVVRRQEDQT